MALTIAPSLSYTLLDSAVLLLKHLWDILKPVPCFTPSDTKEMIQPFCAPSQDYGAACLSNVGFPFSCDWCWGHQLLLPSYLWDRACPATLSWEWWWWLDSHLAGTSVWYPKLSLHDALPVDMLIGWVNFCGGYYRVMRRGGGMCHLLNFLLTFTLPRRCNEGLAEYYLSTPEAPLWKNVSFWGIPMDN